MSDASNDDKIMNIIPKGRYMYFIYMFMFVATAGRVLSALLAIFGLGLGTLSMGLGLVGLIGLALALLGLFMYQAEFTELDRAHFIYASIVYVGGWVAAVFFGSTMAFVLILAYIIVLLILAAQAVLLWTGYNSWQGGRVITKDNLRAEVETALKNR